MSKDNPPKSNPPHPPDPVPAAHTSSSNPPHPAYPPADNPLDQPGGPTGQVTKPGHIAPFKPSERAFDLPEDDEDTPPWEKQEFKRKVLQAGFPGSPASDTGFLAALFRFTGGKVEGWEKKTTDPNLTGAGFAAGVPGGTGPKSPQANPEYSASHPGAEYKDSPAAHDREEFEKKSEHEHQEKHKDKK